MSDIADRMKRMTAVDAAIEEAKAEEAKVAAEVKETAEAKVEEVKDAAEAKVEEAAADDFKDLEGEDHHYSNSLCDRTHPAYFNRNSLQPDCKIYLFGNRYIPLHCRNRDLLESYI